MGSRTFLPAVVSFFALVAMLALAGGAGPSASASSLQEDNPDLDTIVRRMNEAMDANRAGWRPYEIRRDYSLFSDSGHRRDSQVIAQVTFLPPSTKTYRIEKTVGNQRGEKIVRRVLNKESEMAGDNSNHLTPENYDFQLLGRETLEGRPCFVLGLSPKRKRENLIRGRAWVDAKNYFVHRIEGSPAKNPSWWLKDVHVMLYFSSVGGMWLHTGTDAAADVRLFGRRTLTARSISYRTGQAVARNWPP